LQMQIAGGKILLTDYAKTQIRIQYNVPK
jgi:hypothetical protein